MFDQRLPIQLYQLLFETIHKSFVRFSTLSSSNVRQMMNRITLCYCHHTSSPKFHQNWSSLKWKPAVFQLLSNDWISFKKSQHTVRYDFLKSFRYLWFESQLIKIWFMDIICKFWIPKQWKIINGTALPCDL